MTEQQKCFLPDQPKHVWVGFTTGMFPILAFRTDDSAAFWATGGASMESRYVIGPVPIPPGTVIYRGTVIPVVHALVPYRLTPAEDPADSADSADSADPVDSADPADPADPADSKDSADSEDSEDSEDRRA